MTATGVVPLDERDYRYGAGPLRLYQGQTMRVWYPVDGGMMASMLLRGTA